MPEYTKGIKSTARGPHSSCLWTAPEIDMEAVAIAPISSERSGLITVEGWRHFSIWMVRSVTVEIVVAVIPCWPLFRDGPVLETQAFTIATWANTGNEIGCFYFGQELLTSQSGRTHRFSPLIKFFITNKHATQTVAVEAHLYCAE